MSPFGKSHPDGKSALSSSVTFSPIFSKKPKKALDISDGIWYYRQA